MMLHDILRAKGTRVHTIRSCATLDDVVHKLVQNNCGALLVCDPSEVATEPPSRLDGIITERDILRACAASSGRLSERYVRDHMTTQLIIGRLADSVEETMSLLTEKRIRHLPIVESGVLVGIISIGDVVKAQIEQMAVENHYLKTYINS